MDPTAGIFEIFIDPKNVGVVALAVAVMTFGVKILPPKMRNQGWTARLLPVLPIPLCMSIVWIPGIAVSADLAFGERLILGGALGTGLSWGYKVLMQTVLGKDDRIKRKGQDSQ